MIPRVHFCFSKLFVKLINDFGNEGGFDLLLDVLENGKGGENLTLSTLAYITTLISMPHKLWNLEIIKQYGPRVIKAAKK